MQTQEVYTEFYWKHFFLLENTHVEGQNGKGLSLK
jgi:hypothetical protein